MPVTDLFPAVGRSWRRARGRTASAALLPPFALALALVVLVPAPASAAVVLTNVTVANVTPAGFSVVWRGTPGGAAGIRVFSDAAGTREVSVGIEPFPVHTGSPAAANTYEQRLSRTQLRARLSGHGLRSVRVRDARPGTDYFFQLISIEPSGVTNYTPAAPPFPSVRTAVANSFVPDAVLAVLELQGLDVEGRVVTLAHSNALSSLAAVVGDGARPNEVVFNLAELFALGGGSNFTARGSLEFIAEVRGSGPDGGAVTRFPVEFAGAFSVARSVLSSIGSEIVALTVGSSVVRAGETGRVALATDSTVTLNRLAGTLQIPPGHLTDLALEAVAPEIDPASLTLNPAGPGAYSFALQTRAGQSLFGDQELVRLRFLARSNVPSAFVAVRPSRVTALKPGLDPANVALLRPGRVVVVGLEPLLEALPGSVVARELELYGNPWRSYVIEQAPAVTGPWQRVTRVAPTNLAWRVPLPPAGAGNTFYRAAESEANPPELQVTRAGSGGFNVLVFGQAGGAYTLRSSPSLSAPVVWQPYLSFSLTNSFRLLTGFSATNPASFLRVSRP